MIKLTIAGVEVNALTEHDAITITPDEAKRLLEQDNRNFRKVSRGEVAKHINSMKEGKWRFNGDSIALDASGLVKDGQHRLIACMESQIPMKVFPIRINSDINIDNKKKLLFDAILAGMGYHYSVSLSALIKIIYRYESGIRNFYSNKEEIDNNTLIEFFKKNLDIVDSLNLTMPYFKKCGVPHTVLASFYHLAHKRNADMAREFLRLFSLDFSEYERIGITNLNSMYHLKRMIMKTGEKERIPVPVLAAWMIKTWNYWAENKPCRLLSWNCTGANPEIFPTFVDGSPEVF